MINFYKKYMSYLIPILAFIVLLLIVLTLYLKNNDINKLSKLSNEIVSLNSSLKSATLNENFDYDKACIVLESNLNSLKDIKSRISQLELKKSESEKIRQSLNNYININMDLYTVSLNILKNKEVESFPALYKDLINKEKILLESSISISNSSINVNLPKDANIFFVKLNKYINDLYKSNRENDINNSHKLEFLLSINNIFSDISTLKEDIKPALEKIREDKRDISILLDDINKKRSILSAIKDKSYSISIPVGAENCYSSLEEVINSYTIYIDSLESSIKNEISNSKISNNTKTKKTISTLIIHPNNINDLYSDTFEKYSDFLSSINSFEDSLSAYKNK